MTEQMGITETIKWLEGIEANAQNKVFTMYLNTDPSDPHQQGDEWRIHLKNGMRNFEQYLKESGNKEELTQFQNVKKKADTFIKENETNLKRGVIIFASAEGNIWFPKIIQMRVENEFYWEEEPQLDQLINLKNKYPKIGIILTQQNQVKIIHSESRRILDSLHYELDVDTDDWRMKKGPKRRSVSGFSGTHTQKDKFNQRYNENLQRWYKSLAPKLDKHAKDFQWEKIYLIGERDSSNELSEQMNKPIEEVIHKNMLEHNEETVLAEVTE